MTMFYLRTLEAYIGSAIENFKVYRYINVSKKLTNFLIFFPILFLYVVVSIMMREKYNNNVSLLKSYCLL